MAESRDRSPLEPDLGAVPASPLPNHGVPDESDRRWRQTARTVLLVLFVLCAILSLVTNWLASELLDDDRYVATMSALAEDPDIQEAVAQVVSTRLVERFLTTGSSGISFSPNPFTTQNLARLASVQIIDRTVLEVVRSTAFQDLWASANRLVHPQVVALLRGDTVASTNVVDGHVIVDLTPIVNAIQARLLALGFPDLRSVGTDGFTITIFESTELASIQATLDRLVTLRWVLPLLGLLCVAVFVWLSPGKAGAGIQVGLALALAMVLVLAGLALVRAWYIGDRAVTLDDAAARAVFDIATRYLRPAARAIALGGLLVAGAAWVMMPGNAMRNAIDVFVTRYRPALYGAIVVLGTLAVVLQSQPSVSGLAAIALATIVALALVWRLGRPIPLPLLET